MVDLSKYSSQRLMQANERQLKQILQQYKAEHMPLWKFGIFVSYNALSLVGMYYYGAKLRGKRVPPSFANRDKFTIANLLSKGFQHGVIMITIYLAGLFVVCNNTITLDHFRKLTEIQSTYHSFGLKFDPNYQEYLLFSRMRKFQISETLIQEIKDELNKEKNQLIASRGLLPETIEKIREVQELYKHRDKELA